MSDHHITHNEPLIKAEVVKNVFDHQIHELDKIIWVGRDPSKREIIAFIEDMRQQIYKKGRVNPNDLNRARNRDGAKAADPKLHEQRGTSDESPLGGYHQLRMERMRKNRSDAVARASSSDE